MADVFVPLFPEESEDAISARWAAWANEGVSPGDDGFVDVEATSLWWVCTRPGVREAARVYDLMGTEVVAAAFPQWAWGEFLDDHAEREGVTRNSETKAEGALLVSGPVGTVVPAGSTAYVPGTADVEAIDFELLEGGTIPAAAAAPTGVAATLVTGGALTQPTLYRYVVTALDAAGETVASAEVNATTTATLKQITVSWSAVPTATSYKVYRKTGATGPPYDLVGTTTGLSLADTGLTADGTKHPPGANTTGGKLLLAIAAVEAGAAGSVAATAITGLTPPLTGVTVTNPLPVAGGADTEADDPLRVRVVSAFTPEGGANVEFYERIALDYPGVAAVAVLPLWAGDDTVRVVVSDAAGQPVSQSIVDGLQAQLDPVAGKGYGDAPVGAIVTVSTSTAQGITVTSTVELDSGYSLDGTAGTVAVRQRLTDEIAAYLRTVQPGTEVVQRKVIEAMMGVVGVHDVTVALTGAGGNGNVAVAAEPPQKPYLQSLALTAGAV